jgi:hypothetical protein
MMTTADMILVLMSNIALPAPAPVQAAEGGIGIELQVVTRVEIRLQVRLVVDGKEPPRICVSARRVDHLASEVCRGARRG